MIFRFKAIGITITYLRNIIKYVKNKILAEKQYILQIQVGKKLVTIPLSYLYYRGFYSQVLFLFLISRDALN